MRRTALIVIVSASFAIAQPAAAARPAPTYVPDATVTTAPPLEGSVWVVQNPRFTARLALLDTPTRMAWLERHTGLTTDPFASPSGETGSFLTFLLDLECRGDGRIYFEPLTSRLIPPDGGPRSPLDLTTLETAYAMQEKVFPETYTTVLKKVLLERQHELTPGSRATGLIAFHATDMAARRFRLELRLTGPAGEELGFEAPYVALKKSQAKTP